MKKLKVKEIVRVIMVMAVGFTLLPSEGRAGICLGCTWPEPEQDAISLVPNPAHPNNLDDWGDIGPDGSTPLIMTPEEQEEFNNQPVSTPGLWNTVGNEIVNPSSPYMQSSPQIVEAVSLWALYTAISSYFLTGSAGGAGAGAGLQGATSTVPLIDLSGDPLYYLLQHSTPNLNGGQQM